MSLSISIDLASGTPPYEQMREQLAGLIHAGALQPGDRLPVVRALAADLGIAPNTVARAYRELAADGLVTTRRRTGTAVQKIPPPAPTRLQGQAVEFARVARAAGLTDRQVVDLVRGALSPELQSQPP